MNHVCIAGWVAGDSELRTIANGSQLLNFDVSVDGERGRNPIVSVAWFPRDGDPHEFLAGTRIVVVGELRHRRDMARIFVAAHKIEVISQPSHHDKVKMPAKPRPVEESDELWKAAIADARALEGE